MALQFRTLFHQCQKGGDKSIFKVKEQGGDKSIFEVKEQGGDTIKGGDIL